MGAGFARYDELVRSEAAVVYAHLGVKKPVCPVCGSVGRDDGI